MGESAGGCGKTVSVEKGRMETQESGKLECQNPECWDPESQNARIRNAGMLECRKSRLPEIQNAGKPESRNAECWNAGNPVMNSFSNLKMSTSWKSLCCITIYIQVIPGAVLLEKYPRQL